MEVGRRRGAKDHKGEFENVPDTEAANHGTTPPPAISGGSGGSAEAEPPGGPRPTYLCGVTITSATTAQVSSPSSSWPCGPDSELLPFELTVGWVAFWSLLMFFGLKFAGMLRVSEEIEMAGMDVSKHGGSAYAGSEGKA
ncbi:hypothetical protein EMIHUDRAFT_235976 [Emiliania huxleyi CCMP1516]|uniref:Ammonium transporter AmtB-like domain-containing protein n=2 Tax=Emiliania huxleyi TaxID=2903 RepID=A0A0D3JV29_EMIH1|nr:hypothetical protein EMIHUDRAFT_235976 [Emiliania huxleyi CCMP1516]EOD27364.1 hypothetical protein EMIHUDRAFT_235976 [Emiliania huxleyi CCMP1516]|eukprot:XP_005779793.1 hypothetical protein EMIHUDRAFT_235976 [Emiliania huxleyi CCMP1516]